MPNHIQNVLRITAYKHLGAPEGLVDEVLAAIRSDESPFDFNTLIPMPKELSTDARFPMTDAQRGNLDRFGYSDWYQWCPEHWGTKWNAYSVVAGKTGNGEGVVAFETAWAPPMPVLDALAAKFPAAHFRLIWCDEGDDTQHRVWWEKGAREITEEAA